MKTKLIQFNDTEVLIHTINVYQSTVKYVVLCYENDLGITTSLYMIHPLISSAPSQKII